MPWRCGNRAIRRTDPLLQPALHPAPADRTGRSSPNSDVSEFSSESITSDENSDLFNPTTLAADGGCPTVPAPVTLTRGADLHFPHRGSFHDATFPTLDRTRPSPKALTPPHLLDPSDVSAEQPADFSRSLSEGNDREFLAETFTGDSAAAFPSEITHCTLLQSSPSGLETDGTRTRDPFASSSAQIATLPLIVFQVLELPTRCRCSTRLKKSQRPG